MNLINVIRSLLNIRTVRGLPRPGPMPQVGSSIVLGQLKIKLKYPINGEQWYWFSKRGWRMVDMRSNRRKYVSVPDKVFLKLLDANGAERDELHQRIMGMDSDQLNELSNQIQKNEEAA